MLGTTVLGEADLIVTLVAEHAGRVRGVASSARKSRKRFGGSLEPLTRVSVSWVEREGRELHRIESLETLRSFAAMQAEPALQAACAVLAEVTAAVVREGEPEPKTYRLLGAVLEALEAGLDPWTAVRYTEYWTLKLHGVLPDPGLCATCGREIGPREARAVAPRVGVVCGSCPKPGGSVPLRPAEREILARFDVEPPAGLSVPLALVAAGSALDLFLRGALEAFAERTFRTYRHLRGAPGATPS